MDWEDHRAFLSVFRRRSFSAAARPLGLAPATVRRHVESLESALGVSLFLRTGGALEPTAAALALAPLAETMEASAEAFNRAASAERDVAGGLVRVTAPEPLALHVLAPLFAAIRQEHPGLRFALGAQGGVGELLRGAADVAVLLSRPKPDNLELRHVGRLEVGLYAHRGYVVRHGAPRSIADLAAHSGVGTEEEQIAGQVEGALGLEIPHERYVFVSASPSAQYAAVRAGLGIGYCLSAMADHEPELVRILPRISALEYQLTVASRRDPAEPARVAVVREALTRALSAWLHGAEAAAVRPGACG